MEITEFIAKEKITFLPQFIETRPDGGMPDMPEGSTHWRVTFKRGRKTLTTYYTMGPAHRGDVEAADVLNSLALDAQGVLDCPRFAEFAREYGYDEDSRKAESTFKACLRIKQKLERFLGGSFDALLFNTERL